MRVPGGCLLASWLARSFCNEINESWNSEQLKSLNIFNENEVGRQALQVLKAENLSAMQRFYTEYIT
jgi:hypothetical protein